MEDPAKLEGGESGKKSVEKKEVIISEYPVQSVVVYADRAEVKAELT